MELLEELNGDHGQTFVMVTHDAGIGARCDRLISMTDGVITSEESL